MRREALEQAVGVAEQKRTGDEMVSPPQQGEQQCADGAHAGAEAHRGDTVLHARDLLFECRDSGIHLPAIGIAAALALENVGKVLHVVVAIGDGGVDRLLQRAVLDRTRTVRMHDACGESAHGSVALAALKGQVRNIP